MDIHNGDPRVHCVDTMRDCDFFPENLRGRYDNMRFFNCTFHNLTGSDFYRFHYCVFDNCTFYYCIFYYCKVFMRTTPFGPLYEAQPNEMRYITLMDHIEFYYCSVDCIPRFVDLRYLTDAICISSTVLLLGYEYGEGAERFHHRAACPTEGSFIGYKKVRYDAWNHSGKAIVTLEISAHAKRSNAFGIKCRCSEAKVLKIESLPGEKDIPEGAIVYSDFDPNFRYKVGDTVKPFGFGFDDRWWNECGPGIHFFYLKEDAIEYSL